MALCINPTPSEQGRSAEAEYRRFQTLFAAGGTTEAHEALERLLRDFPHFAVAHNDMGVLCYTRGEKEKARHHYQQAARLAPGNGTFKKNLADFLYIVSGQPEEALQIYLEVLAANPREIETLLILGNISIALNKFDDARVFFSKVLEFSPDDPVARRSLSSLAKDGGGRQSLEPQDAAYENAQELAGAGRVGQAIDILRELVAERPEHALAQNDLGVLYFRTGNKLRSFYHYTKATRIAPESSLFQKNLADFYFVEMGESEEALNHYRAVLDRDPDDIEALLALGQICIAVNLIEEANRHYRRVLELEPQNNNALQAINLAG